MKEISIAVVGFVCLVIVMVGIMLSSSYNRWVSTENQIYAKQEVIGNTLTTFINKSKTSMGIADKQAELVIKAITEANNSRYGGGGSQGAMQWIKENNPNMPTELFSKVMTMVQAGYAKVELEQNENIDIIRSYKTSLERFPANISAMLLGFPKKYTLADLQKLSKPIMNEASTKAMETKKMEALTL